MEGKEKGGVVFGVWCLVWVGLISEIGSSRVRRGEVAGCGLRLPCGGWRSSRP